jgi:hypothetical protein
MSREKTAYPKDQVFEKRPYFVLLHQVKTAIAKLPSVAVVPSFLPSPL